jgi:prepilin-type N-terminal cleavage/methylation domain-containing protein
MLRVRGMEASRAVATETGGFTLPELLIATVIGLIVIGAAVTAMTVGVHSQPRLNSQAASVQQARTTMERITRELRQGSSVPTATASQLSIVTYVKSATCGGTPANSAIACRVTYTCATGACSRTEAKADGTAPGPAEQVLSGLSSTNVFSYTPPTSTAPASVGVTISFAAQGANQGITLSDAAALRNPGTS